MRTHTTCTDLRRIMKLHADGLNAADISQDVFIHTDEIKRVIAARTKRAKKTKETTE